MADAAPLPKPPIFKIRTFADDVKRAASSLPMEALKTGKVEQYTPPPTARTMVADINAGVSAPTEPKKVPVPQRTFEEEPVFDIRHEATGGSGEATIIQDRRASRWSLFSELGHALEAWWEELTHSAHEATVAFEDKIAEREVNKEEEAELKERAKELERVHSLSADVEKRLTAPVATSVATPATEPVVAVAQEQPAPWHTISEPRAGTGPTTFTDEHAATYKNELRNSLPPPTVLPKKSIKAARVLRVPEALKGEIISKDKDQSVAPAVNQEELAAARARLAALTATDAPPEKAHSRDLPFISPVFDHQETSPIRTYRYDALHDVKERQLSAEQIAAAQMQQRAETHAPIPVHRTHMNFTPLLVGAAMVAVLGASGTMLYLFVTKERAPAPTATTIPALFTADSTQAFTLHPDRRAFLEELNLKRTSAPSATGAFTHLYPTMNEGGVERPGRVDEIAGVLDLRAPATFSRSLSGIMFGTYGSSHVPFVVMKVSTFDAAFAGMLAWEENISVDLAPFFGEPVRRSYDPDSLTVDQTRPAHFSDVILRNNDVRILYDEQATERILYSFVDQNTIVITASSEALLALMGVLK